MFRMNVFESKVSFENLSGVLFDASRRGTKVLNVSCAKNEDVHGRRRGKKSLFILCSEPESELRLKREKEKETVRKALIYSRSGAQKKTTKK